MNSEVAEFQDMIWWENPRVLPQSFWVVNRYRSCSRTFHTRLPKNQLSHPVTSWPSTTNHQKTHEAPSDWWWVSQEDTQLQQLRCKIPLYESKNQTPTEYAYARHLNLETCETWSMPASPEKGSKTAAHAPLPNTFFLVGILRWWHFSGWWQPKCFFEFSPRNLEVSWSNLTFAYFSRGLLKPPTSFGDTKLPQRIFQLLNWHLLKGARNTSWQGPWRGIFSVKNLFKNTWIHLQKPPELSESLCETNTFLPIRGEVFLERTWEVDPFDSLQPTPRVTEFRPPSFPSFPPCCLRPQEFRTEAINCFDHFHS